LAQPNTWSLALCLLVAPLAIAQPQLLARQRQDRRASLPTPPAEPMLELYVAANNLTTLAFNGPLDRDSLVVDRTRFKWVDVGERLLALEPFADVGPGDKLILQIGFKDKALPAKILIAIVSKADVMDGKVEVDRRANTPEALLAALTQKEAELEELKARCEASGPSGLVLSKWLTAMMRPKGLDVVEPSAADAGGLEVRSGIGYEGGFSTLVAISLRNLPGQPPWALGQARLISPGGASVKMLSVQMKPASLAPGEVGLVVVETKTPPWVVGKTFRVELVDAGGQRRLSFNLLAK
jgi:uncharacterized protein (TIGR02268 family)